MDFPIIPAKTGLVCFDTLNIYLHPDDPAAQAEVNQSGILGRLERLGNACRAAGIPLFYPQADHRPDFKDFAPHIVDAWWDVAKGQGPVKSTPPPVKGGTHGAEVIPEHKPAANRLLHQKAPLERVLPDPPGTEPAHRGYRHHHPVRRRSGSRRGQHRLRRAGLGPQPDYRAGRMLRPEPGRGGHVYGRGVPVLCPGC